MRDPAEVARIDQHFAQSTQALDQLVSQFRLISPTDHEKFESTVAIVQIAFMKVDPLDKLPVEQSNELVLLGEMLALAVQRLARQDNPA